MKIICVGKLKEEYLTNACNEYLKRLSKYTKLDIIELKDSDIKSESELILKNINDKDFVVTLELEGKMLDSPTLSKKIDEWLMLNPNLVFIIGGSDGLDEKVRNRSNFKLSFSTLTFPHQLFRVMLLEQIYRAFKISNNETYHK